MDLSRRESKAEALMISPVSRRGCFYELNFYATARSRRSTTAVALAVAQSSRREVAQLRSTVVAHLTWLVVLLRRGELAVLLRSSGRTQ